MLVTIPVLSNRSIFLVTLTSFILTVYYCSNMHIILNKNLSNQSRWASLYLKHFMYPGRFWLWWVQHCSHNLVTVLFWWELFNACLGLIISSFVFLSCGSYHWLRQNLKIMNKSRFNKTVVSKQGVTSIRWPRSATANSKSSRQTQSPHGKFKVLTANSKSSRQTQSAHGKLKVLTANSDAQNYTTGYPNCFIAANACKQFSGFTQRKRTWRRQRKARER